MACWEYVVDFEMETGQDTREALEPEAQRLSVVALTTDRVGAEEAVADVRRDRSQQFIPPMIVDVVEALSDPPVDDRTVEHQVSLLVFRTRMAKAIADVHNPRVLVSTELSGARRDTADNHGRAQVAATCRREVHDPSLTTAARRRIRDAP
jgi:hypothetical protein